MTTGFSKALGSALLALAVLSLAACANPRTRAKSPPRAAAAKPVTPPSPVPAKSEPSGKSAVFAGPRTGPAPARRPVHVVRRGDTVYAISRRYGVPARSVIDHNGLRPPYPLKVGQRLSLPVPRRHRVAHKETVYGISRRYGVPVRSVIDANRLVPPYSLRIGQALLIPVLRAHVVAKGETVYSISRRYGVELSELVRLNRVAPPYTIKPAQSLVLPNTRPAAAPALGAPAGKTLAAVRPAKATPTLAAIPQPPPRAGSKFLWPVKGRIILGYGPKRDGLHNDGINIKAPRGTPVRAAENGVVAYSGNELRGFGNLLLIKHAGGWVTAYAHTEQVSVRRGDKVRRGQTIGRVGSTGSVASPQLHFEVRKGTRAVDPTRLLGRQTAGGG
ncbi:MAG: LysM peptidoglycan-binding domain-containing protein [Rhodospirillales bacterium]|nr:LysM peptidoglycan-binding domain-containing protein [Rhodospirillales bacterium]MDH3917230.1 LysM peptidoglycan-binding domain-containing protein [Rhodospirillales bacterium]